jgi:hypothetical protein
MVTNSATAINAKDELFFGESLIMIYCNIITQID